jgi:membrane protein
VALPPVAAGRRILDRYSAAGGALLAGGLAYAALFAIVPGMLLLAGVVGLLVSEPAERQRLVDVVSGVLPPLREVIETVLTEAARDAAPVSLLGAVALLWGTSRFAVAFQEAIARVGGGDRRRGLLAQNVGAIGSVVLMIVAIVLSTFLSGVLAFLEAGASAGVFQIVGTAISVALGLLPIAATIGATILVYRIVPVPRPPWRAVVIPGVFAGLALTVVARVFAFLAPRLIGSAALLGTIATVFAALAWLALSFQAILLGMAWVRDRAERTTPPGAKPIQT